LTPEYVLAVLLGLEVYISEREWGRGHAPELQRALTLLAMRKRKKATKYTSTMRRILAHVIAEQIGVYLIFTAKKIMEQSSELQRAADDRIKRTHATPAALAYRAKRYPNKKKRSPITENDWLKPPASLVVNNEPVPDEVRRRFLERTFNR
jgi:hypothetical protein